MAKMFFELTDDDRVLLEALRVKMGLRSHAETLRTLIRNGPATLPRSYGSPSARTIAASRLTEPGAITPYDPVTGDLLPLGPIAEMPGSRLKKGK